MFYTLHRLLKLIVILFFVGVLVWVWQQRHILEPAFVWHDVYKNGGIERTGTLPQVEGRGSYIFDGHTFQLKTSENRVYVVRLTGFESPAPPLSAEGILLEKRRRDALKFLVLSNSVRIEITYSNQNSLLGIAHAGNTNVNVYFITNHLAQFKGDFVKSVPRDVQYTFFAAARAGRKTRPAETNALALKSP